MSWWTVLKLSYSGPCWSPQRTGVSPSVRRAHTWWPEVETRVCTCRERTICLSFPSMLPREPEHTNPLPTTTQRLQKSPRKIRATLSRAGRINQTAAPTPAPPASCFPACMCQDCSGPLQHLPRLHCPPPTQEAALRSLPHAPEETPSAMLTFLLLYPDLAYSVPAPHLPLPTRTQASPEHNGGAVGRTLGELGLF